MNVRANKVLLLASSLATLALLGTAAYQENVLQEWRQIQRSYQKKLGATGAKVPHEQLRQIVVPTLGVTDRCVTCHIGMAPGEAPIAGDRLFDRHPGVVHDPADYGCTICHGGQGRATTADAAHGRVHFWPEPMVPREFAYAGCGTCHTHLAVPNLARLERGRAIFERSDCLACHRLDGRGGTLRPGGAGGMEGPDLSRVGFRGVPKGWLEAHTARAANDPRYHASFGGLTDDERGALEVYLSSRVGAPGLLEAKALFHTRGCRGCHKVAGVGGSDGPDLTRVGEKDPGRIDFTHVPEPHDLASYFAEHFRSPAAVVKGSNMPTLGLTEPEIRGLVFYLFSLRRGEIPEAYWPIDRIEAERFRQREFADDPATLYGTFCAACHGPQGEGMRYAGATAFPAIANQDFLRIAPDSLLTATIRHGRPGRRMPAWGEREGALREPDIRALARYVRSLAGGIESEPDPRPARWVQGDAARGRTLYGTNCARCHGAEGRGGEGTALNNPVLLASATDTYLIETVKRGRRGTSMAGFAEGSTVTATLSPEEVESVVAYIRSWEVNP